MGSWSPGLCRLWPFSSWFFPLALVWLSGGEHLSFLLPFILDILPHSALLQCGQLWAEILKLWLQINLSSSQLFVSDILSQQWNVQYSFLQPSICGGGRDSRLTLSEVSTANESKVPHTLFTFPQKNLQAFPWFLLSQYYLNSFLTSKPSLPLLKDLLIILFSMWSWSIV